MRNMIILWAIEGIFVEFCCHYWCTKTGDPATFHSLGVKERYQCCIAFTFLICLSELRKK